MAAKGKKTASSKKKKKTKSKVRVCMIGAGGMSNNVHYPSLASFRDVAIAGISDLNPDRLKSTADKYEVVGRYADYKKMIEDIAPDGVYVVGQPQIMIDIWYWCLEHGLNLYIEKPMGLTMHEARMMTELAESKGLITQVSHQRRSCPLLVKMRKECLKKGPITNATCEFYKCAIQPFVRARDHMMDDGVHVIDTVRWMCGGEILDVESQCKRLGVPDINWISATLHFDNGSTGYVKCNWASGRRVFRVQMHAPGICTDAEPEGKAYLYADGDYEGVEYDTKEVAGSDELRVFGGFEAKNREFIDSIKTGKDVTSSPFRDCVKTMEVAELILAHALFNGE